MALKNLNLEQLAKIDGGRISVCFQRELERCVRDIEDRPADDRDRIINVKIKLTPDAGEADGLLDGAKAKVEVESKLPTYRSRRYDFGVRNGQLRFEETSLDDHRRQPLPGMEEGEYEDA